MRARRSLNLLALLALAGGGAHAQSLAPLQPVEQDALAHDAFATGVLTSANGALPGDLWKGANGKDVAFLLRLAPGRPRMPALGEALRRVLLSSGDLPAGAPAGLGGEKLEALVRAGFADEARTVASLSSTPAGDPAVSEALALADILDSKLDDACARGAALTQNRDAIFWVKLRVLCYAANKERDAAELALGLLREQGALSDVDDALLSAVVAGTPPKSAPPIEDAFHLAAYRALNLPIGAGLLAHADGGVLVAVMNDTGADPAARIGAGVAAVSAGAASGDGLRALFQQTPVPDGEAPQADNPLSDVAAYRRIEAIATPEALRDKAAAVAAQLGAATTAERLRAAARVYENDLKAFDGLIVAPKDAGQFALAEIALGDAAAASRWLMQMWPQAGAPPLADADTLEFIDLVSVLGALDPTAAKKVADAANVAPRDLFDSALQDLRPVSSSLPQILTYAFDAAIKGVKGEAGLAALAASAVSKPDDAVARVAVLQSLRAAGLGGLSRRLIADDALTLKFGDAPPSAIVKAAATGVTPAPKVVVKTPAAPAAKTPAGAPRVKPKPKK